MYSKNKSIQSLNNIIDDLNNIELNNILKKIRINSYLIDKDFDKLLVNIPNEKKESLIQIINGLKNSNEFEPQNVKILVYILLINNAYSKKLDIEYDYFIKDISTKTSFLGEEKIKCLTSIEPFVNAIRGIKIIFESFNIKLSLDDLIEDKNIISYIYKKIKESEKEIKEIEDDKEILKQLEKNIKLSEKMISFLITNNNVANNLLESYQNENFLNINEVIEQFEEKLNYYFQDNQKFLEKIENLEEKINNLQNLNTKIDINEENFIKKIIDNMNNSATSIIEKVNSAIKENSKDINKTSEDLIKTTEDLKEEWGKKIQELDNKIAIFEESASKIDNLSSLLEQINTFIKENVSEIQSNLKELIKIKKEYEEYSKKIEEFLYQKE